MVFKQLQNSEITFSTTKNLRKRNLFLLSQATVKKQLLSFNYHSDENAFTRLNLD